MDTFDNEENSTVIYSEEPNLSVAVSDSINGPSRYNAAKLNAITNATVAQVSASHPISGQVNKTTPRPRGQGVHPKQMPVQQASEYQQQQQMIQQQQIQQQQMMQEQMRQQQMMQQQYYQQPYYQQPYYQQAPQYQPQQVQQVPANDPNDPIKRYPPNPGEPYTEMIIVNDSTYHFYIDLPGVKPEDIHARYVNMYLIISGERKLNATQLMPKTRGRGNKGKMPKFEAQVTVPQQLEHFEYSFYFPRPVADTIKSSLANGVLHVEMSILSPGGSDGIAISIS